MTSRGVVIQWWFWCWRRWQLNGGVDGTTSHRHCPCCHHRRFRLLEGVCWVAKACGPSLCDLIADGVDIKVERSLIIDKINGRSVMVNGGWRSGCWRCYGYFYTFGSTAGVV